MSEQDIRALAIVLDMSQRGRMETPSIAADARVRATFDAAAAYRVQAALVDRRLMRGEHIVGVTGRGSVVGRLTDAMQIPNDGAIGRDQFIHPIIKPALAYRLSLDFDRTHAIAALAPALDISDSRYRGGSVTETDVVADNASAASFVVGEWVDATEASDRSASFTVGTETAEVAFNRHAQLLAGIAEVCRQHGIDLPGGSIVLVGDDSAGQPVDEAQVRCTASGLGGVAVTLTA